MREPCQLPEIEAALWNLTINSNGVFVELYEQPLWEIYHSRGTGPTAAVLDSDRPSLAVKKPGHPAPFSKNLFTWSEELHGRRKILVNLANPHLGDPFPTSHAHTFSKVIAAPETYYYINPSKCPMSTEPDRVGRITVVP